MQYSEVSDHRTSPVMLYLLGRGVCSSVPKPSVVVAHHKPGAVHPLQETVDHGADILDVCPGLVSDSVLLFPSCRVTLTARGLVNRR